MTVEISLGYDKEYVSKFSEGLNEPEWMKTLRLDALQQAERLPMPKPDKTKIDRWNFTKFTHDLRGEKLESLAELPEQIKNFVDQDKAEQNLVIQRDQRVAFVSYPNL